MPNSSYAKTVPATPEYVLAVLQDELRQIACLDDTCDPDAELSFESTVRDWRIAQDLLPTRQLGRALNEIWELTLSDAEWRSVLAPEKKKTLRDVAELISIHASRTELKPLAIAGTRCLAASAFLAVRDCLEADGVDVSEVTPSTPLTEFTRHHWRTFLGRASRLAPGRLPPVEMDLSAHEKNLAIGCLGAALLPLGCFLVLSYALWYLFWLPFAGLGLLTYATIRGEQIRNSAPGNVSFGNLRTFRDLAVCLVDETDPR